AEGEEVSRVAGMEERFARGIVRNRHQPCPPCRGDRVTPSVRKERARPLAQIRPDFPCGRSVEPGSPGRSTLSNALRGLTGFDRLANIPVTVSGLDALIGTSAATAALRTQVSRLASRVTSATSRLPALLILGETGVGKGLLVRILHQESARRDRPLVEVNCAAIPENLIESELFGFERGAFTDARQSNPGLFQTAHGGLLFLDEVGTLPLAAQAKLLTALEQRQVRRLGSTRPEPVDAWIVSATNADLVAAANRREFRLDLYHRLSAVTINVPPLRERGR